MWSWNVCHLQTDAKTSVILLSLYCGKIFSLKNLLGFECLELNKETESIKL